MPVPAPWRHWVADHQLAMRPETPPRAEGAWDPSLIDSLMRSGSGVSAVAVHISTRVAAAASIPATLTAMTTQRSTLTRSDDAVETCRSACCRRWVRELLTGSVPADSFTCP